MRRACALTVVLLAIISLSGLLQNRVSLPECSATIFTYILNVCTFIVSFLVVSCRRPQCRNLAMLYAASATTYDTVRPRGLSCCIDAVLGAYVCDRYDKR